MRILYLTNFYPPLRAGGYAQLSHEVAQALKSRGHQVGVLTSNYRHQQAPDGEEDVFRMLHLEGDLNYYHPLDFLLNWSRRQAENRLSSRQVMEDFTPDVILVWSLWGLSKAPAAMAEALMPDRVVYYLAGFWPVKADMHERYWETPARSSLFRLPKQFLARQASRILDRESNPALAFKNVLCVSAGLQEALRAEGLKVEDARIIYNGINLEQFSNVDFDVDRNHETYKLLYAGQLVHHKGVHTALRALKKLVESGHQKFRLTILGAGHPDYIASLRKFVKEHRLQKFITFHDPVPRSEMPLFLRRYDVLVFPSIYAEPLARIVMEAMAAGLVVIGTTTGGTGELLMEGKTGLTFPPEDASKLSEKILWLAKNKEKGGQLISNAQKLVHEHFSLSRMVEALEAYLIEVFEGIGSPDTMKMNENTSGN